jgi:tetratricopeptide (TPR) repeat protein
MKTLKKTLVFTLLTLLFASAGFIWGVSEYSLNNGIPTPVAVNAIMVYLGFQRDKNAPVEKPEPPKPPEPDKPHKPPESPKPPSPHRMTVEAAQKILSDAEADYKLLRFESASGQLTKVLKGEPTPELTQQAIELNKKCIAFNRLIKPIRLEDMTDLSGMVRMKLSSGQEIVARLIEEGNSSVRVNHQGMEKTYQLKEISSYTKLSAEDYKKLLKTEYEKKLIRFDNPSAMDYYRLAIFCYKGQLYDESLNMLELAWEKDEAIADLVSGDKPVPQTDDPKPPEPIDLSGLDDKEQIALAQKYYAEGKDHLENTFNKGPDFDAENEKARNAFKKSLEVYREIRKNKPNDDTLALRIEEIEKSLIFIRKQTRIKKQ